MVFIFRKTIFIFEISNAQCSRCYRQTDRLCGSKLQPSAVSDSFAAVIKKSFNLLISHGYDSENVLSRTQSISYFALIVTGVETETKTGTRNEFGRKIKFGNQPLWANVIFTRCSNLKIRKKHVLTLAPTSRSGLV